MCTKNHNHVMSGSWDMECNRQNFLPLGTVFCSFTPTPYGTIKLKFWKNQKNTRRYYHFTNVYHKWKSYDIGFFRYGLQQITFFALLPPNNLKNQNLKKVKKTTGDIIILHKFTRNHDHMIYRSLDMAYNGLNWYFSFWAIFYPLTSLTAQKIKI